MNRGSSKAHGGTGLALGAVLKDRYKVSAMIGISGFDITYKAWDRQESRDVAIKEYCPQQLVSRANDIADYMLLDEYNNEYNYGLQKFLQEAESLSRFQNNDNIVTVYEYFEESSTAYMVMEYLSGLSLKEYMERHDNRVSGEVMVHISFSVIEALEAIHSAGMVHRDLSPESIFICDDNKVKLVDFGAVEMDAHRENLSSTIRLKPGYAPVEQYASGNKTGPWTDIYALGATLYYMTTGVRPVDAPGRVVQDELKEPRAINKRIPRPLNRAIMKAMSIKKDDRYDSAVQMAEEIMEGVQPETEATGAAEQGEAAEPKLTNKLDSSAAAQNRPTGPTWKPAEEKPHEKQTFRLADAKNAAIKNHSFMLAQAEQSGVLTAADRTVPLPPVKKPKEKKDPFRESKHTKLVYELVLIAVIIVVLVPIVKIGVNKIKHGTGSGTRLERVCANLSETDEKSNRTWFKPQEDRYYHFEITGVPEGKQISAKYILKTPGERDRDGIIGIVEENTMLVVPVPGSGKEDPDTGTETLEIYNADTDKRIGSISRQLQESAFLEE